LPMICSGVAEDDGDAPDRRGAYGFDGVAMLTALAYQPDQSSLSACPVWYSTTSTDVDTE
jgi:hypothetical protein